MKRQQDDSGRTIYCYIDHAGVVRHVVKTGESTGHFGDYFVAIRGVDAQYFSAIVPETAIWPKNCAR